MSVRYSETIQQHVAHPHNAGPLERPSGVGRATNEACGDLLHLHLRLAEDRILEAGFEATGCPPALAIGSLLTVLLPGRTAAEARALGASELERALGGVPKAKRHALVLALDAVRLALEDAGC